MIHIEKFDMLEFFNNFLRNIVFLKSLIFLSFINNLSMITETNNVLSYIQ